MRGRKRISYRALELFDKLPLSYRFAAALLLPIIAIIWMSGSNILELHQSVNRLDALNDNITLVTAAGQLVGTLQRERGLSVLITDTGTERLRSRLMQSRERTNQQLIKDGFWQGELWNRRKNGEFYAELASMSAITPACHRSFLK
ncbi:hypothetical protein [Idiomarina sp.]|uniref:hypothetical protein n=1 Tax=Idiomarina sp. TaxID=1874361 RepID=UPI0026121C14|nr:hypothetical protein [Idiomarina sp.]